MVPLSNQSTLFISIASFKLSNLEINGLEQDYFPEDTDFFDYLTPTGHINMELLLDNFRNFIARAGFRILQVPKTPKEYVGQDLLYAYLDQFVSLIRGVMYLEVQTGRGRMDLVIFHNDAKIHR